MFGRLVFLALVSIAVPATAQTVHHVPAGGSLQSALNGAQPGDTITLEPGAVYSGNFVLPAKAGDQFITIRSAAPDAELPGPGVRMTPAAAARLPKLRSPNVMSVLRTAAGAHHYRLMFLEIYSDVAGASTLVSLGDGSSAQNTLAQVPYALEVDRVYIHGHAVYGAKRGIGLNSASTTITSSYISEIKAVGQDTQAIAGWNGPGPYVITNNYLEGAGENVMFGGADPAIPNLVPSNITFTHNHVAKPLSWRGTDWTIKNLFELKSAQHVIIDRNLFENNWAAAQTGSAILLKSVNQDGNAPWSVVQHVQFTNNVVRNVASALNILGRDPRYPAIEANNIVVRNNLFANVSASAFGGTGRLLLINGGTRITFDHNTAINDGSSTVFADGNPVFEFVFTNNIVLDNGLGIKGTGTGEGAATLATFFPGSLVTGNIIANANGSVYPPGNHFPALERVGFVDYGGGDYRLASASPFKNPAGDPGVDFAALASAPPGPLPPPQTAPPPATGPSNAPPGENMHVPHGLNVSVSGTSVTLRWLAPSSGEVLQYFVEAGHAPGLSNVARLLTGSAATVLVAQGVPNGMYHVRVRAVTTSGMGAPSSDIAFAVGALTGCGVSPLAPHNLSANVSGAAVQLRWTPSSGGCAPTHYIVQAGSAPGLSNLAQVTLGGPTLLASAPPGVYYVRVIAANATGTSAPSNEIVVTVTP